MDIFDAIQNRKSIRRFTSDIPTKDEIKIIINAARLAPSSHNKQMWHFMVIFNNELKESLKKSIENKYEEIKNLPEAANFQEQLDFSKAYSTFFANAPVVIAVFMEPSINTVCEIMKRRNVSSDVLDRIRPRPDLQSIGAAIQNITLASEALGYGTCWMTAPIIAYKELEETLNFDAKYNLVALIALGKSDNGHSKRAWENKKALDEILTIIE